MSPSGIIPDREGSPIILMMSSSHADTLDDDGGPSSCLYTILLKLSNAFFAVKLHVEPFPF